jgi:hypothetical protein
MAYSLAFHIIFAAVAAMPVLMLVASRAEAGP